MENNIKTHFKLLINRFKTSGFHLLLITALLTIIWIIGYLGFSLLWIYIVIIIYGFYIYQNELRRLSFERGIKLSINEEEVLHSYVDLPAWVNFPDVERADWINKIIVRLWPSITTYLQELIDEVIVPKIKESVSNFEIKNINFGNTSPKIGGIRMYNDDRMSRDEIFIDVDIYFYSDSEITAMYNNITFGIRDFEMKANLRVHATPLLPVIPFVGAFSLSLLKNPYIQFNFTNVGALLNAPYLKTWLKEAIIDAVGAIIVIPNRLPFQLIKTANMKRLLFPMPDGVIRMKIIEAKNLSAQDVEIFGKKNKSDPYVTVRIGAQKFSTKVINNNLNPVWNEYVEAVIESTTYQSIEIELFDKDRNNDDFLGKIDIGTKFVYEKGFTDTWMQLEEIQTGSLHLALTWLSLSSDPGAFQVIETSDTSLEQPLSIGFFYVLIDSAKHLRCAKGDSDPSPYVELSLGNVTKKTSVKNKTINPVWRNPFNFLIQNVHVAKLHITVKDDKTKKVLGCYVYKVQELMNDKEMEKFETIHLSETDQDSTLQMNLALRALIPNKRKSSKYVSPSTLGQFKEFTDDLNSIRRRHNSQHQDNSDNQNESPVSDFEHTVFQDDNNNINHNGDNGSFILNPSIISGPKISISMWHRMNNKTLFVVINKLVDLPEINSELYIKVYMHPKDTRHTTRKTNIVKKNSNENVFVFDAQFEFSIDKPSVHISMLYFNIKSSIKRKSAFIKRCPTIAYAKVDLSDKISSTSITAWYPVEMDIKNGTESIKSETSF